MYPITLNFFFKGKLVITHTVQAETIHQGLEDILSHYIFPCPYKIDTLAIGGSIKLHTGFLDKAELG